MTRNERETSPLYLRYISPMPHLSMVRASSLKACVPMVCSRYGGDMGEICGIFRGDNREAIKGEI